MARGRDRMIATVNGSSVALKLRRSKAVYVRRGKVYNVTACPHNCLEGDSEELEELYTGRRFNDDDVSGVVVPRLIGGKGLTRPTLYMTGESQTISTIVVLSERKPEIFAGLTESYYTEGWSLASRFTPDLRG